MDRSAGEGFETLAVGEFDIEHTAADVDERKNIQVARRTPHRVVLYLIRAITYLAYQKMLDYLRGVWFAMHHSNRPDLEAMIVTCYLDESATDGGTQQAVVGGLQVNESHFIGFDSKWRAMLARFSLAALHMKDFGVHGMYARMPAAKREAIFSDAVRIIEDHNICTMAVTVDHTQFKSVLPGAVRQSISVYSLAFMGCVIGSHQIAKGNGYGERIPFVMDTGNPYAGQVRVCHAAISEVQAGGHFLNLGSLTFDADENVTALQAADIICWGVRRRATGTRIAYGFDPIERLLDAKGHNQSPVSEVSMRDLLSQIQSVNPEILRAA